MQSTHLIEHANEFRHIRSLYAKRAKNDENSSTLAQTLETNILTAFKGEHKFIFELLQNADDVAKQDEILEVSFVLKKISFNGRYYLIFSHSGMHFTAEDVEKICDNGQQYLQEKSRATQKIGYKGIGFKAVFSIADCVHIISNGYNFRFDQHYFTQLKQGKKAYPWPIIPVQNSDQDLLPELAVLIKKDWVTFVLQIRPDVDIINELQFLQTNSRLLLFLNRVSSIELVHETDEVKIDIQSDGEQDKKIFINGVFSSAWIIRKFVTRIPESINTFLNTLQDSECPQRLKSTMQTKITFAAQINAVNQIVVSTYNQLFCYLPTQINCGFACLVNGDFLLNTERTRLMDNQWNGFLLKRIGYFQIKFLSELATNPLYQKQIFTLLPNSTISSVSQIIEQEYLSGFQQATKDIAFIPSLRMPSRLLKVPEVVLDNTGFYENFNDFDFSSGGLIAASQDGMGKFNTLFVHKIKQKITIEYVCSDLSNIVNTYSDFSTQQYILNFLRLYFNSHDVDARLKDIIKNQKIVLSTRNKLCAPNELYLPTKSVAEMKGIECLELINPKLQKFTEVLQKIGVRLASRIEFIRHFIKKDILNGGISAENVVSVSCIILTSMENEELKEEDWEYLKTILVKTKGGDLKPANKCYFSDDYLPAICLENYLTTTDIFITDEYLQAKAPVASWKKFFKKLGVKDDLVVHNYSKLNVGKARAEKPFMPEYLKYISRQGCNPSGFHDIENFVDIDFIEYASLPEFSDLFWQKLIEGWPSIERHSKSCHYRTNRNHYAIKTTYLQFCVNTFVKVTSHQQETCLVAQVFMPSLQWLVADILPVAKINLQIDSIPTAFFSFFGFKTTLSVVDCLNVLDHVNTSEPDLQKQTRLLECLLESPRTTEDLEKIQSWSGQLFSQNNTLQSVRQLQYWMPSVLLQPRGIKWLKNFSGIEPSGMKQLSELFAIPIVDAQLTQVLIKEENHLYAELAQKNIAEKLPIIALIQAMPHNISTEEMLGELTEKLKLLTLISSDEINLQIGNNIQTVSAYLQHNKLYFKKNYDHPLTRGEFCKMLSIYFNLDKESEPRLADFLYLKDEDLVEFMQQQQLDVAKIVKSAVNKLKITVVPETVSQIASTTKGVVINSPLQHMASATVIRDECYATAKNHLQQIMTQQPVLPNMQLISFEKAKFDAKIIAKTRSAGQVMLQTSFAIETLNSIEPNEMHANLQNNHPQKLRSGIVDEQKIDVLSIGRWGEKLVYEKLKLHYLGKYPNCTFAETIQGFKLIGDSFDKRTSSLAPLSLELIWYNKHVAVDSDHSLGSDLMLVKNNIRRHIEVKSSSSNKKKVFRITACEWNLMQEMQNLYRIFRVMHVGSDNPRIITIKNPYQAIEHGNLKIKAYEVKL